MSFHVGYHEADREWTWFHPLSRRAPQGPETEKWCSLLILNSLILVLLSTRSCAWKIGDFEFTLEGTSKRAYTTKFARGTECYRAPELVSDLPTVSMKSDIWALGCILYELVGGGKKAFPHDFHVFQYRVNKCKPDTPSFPEELDNRLKSYILELLDAMLEVDWWKRPSAREILNVLSSLHEETTKVYLVDGSGALRQPLRLYYVSESWKAVFWKRCWFVPLTFTCWVYKSTQCNQTITIPQILNPRSDDDLKICPLYECNCSDASKQLMEWAFVVNKDDL